MFWILGSVLESGKCFVFMSHRTKVTNMGSTIAHRIDYNGVGALRGQRHIPSRH